MAEETSLAVVAVIEDDDVERRALGRVLSLGGFEPVLFESAEAFLASPPRLAHCLIIDVHLTGMSGIDLQQRLSSAASTVPIIVTTGNRSDVVRERAERAGCAAFLRKPVNATTILGLLESLPRQPHA
jgi:FixJ family two-component response regulator